MQTTLPERLREAMAGPPKVTAVAIARHCGIAPPSVHGWLSGKSKTIEGANLVRTAELLHVNAKWLAEGVGRKFVTDPQTPPSVQERVADYLPAAKDPTSAAAVDLMLKLSPDDRRGALAALRTHVQNLGPPLYGQALQMAR